MVHFSLVTFLTQSAAGVGVLGALVGGGAAAARTLAEHKKGLVDRSHVIREIGKEAAGVGIASAASVVAAGAVGGGLILSLGTVLVTATAAKYAWDRGLDKVLRATGRHTESGHKKRPKTLVVR